MTRRLVRLAVALAIVVAAAAPAAARQIENLPPGIYLLEFEVLSDDCGHDPFIDEFTGLVFVEIGEDGTVTIEGDEPWVTIVAEVGQNGRLEGTGIGVVAGFTDVTIEMAGEVVEPGVVEGFLAYGVGGELPGGCPIVWTLTLIAENPPEPTTTTTSSSTTTSTTSTSTTTTSTTQPSTTSTEPGTPTTTGAPAGEDSGGFPWMLLIAGGALLVLIGVFLLRNAKDCEDELAAWLRAKRACDDADAAVDRAERARDDARTARDDAEEELDEACDAYPPACSETDPRDSWAEDPSRPGSRIDGLDVAAGSAWSRHLWGQYRDGEMTAAQLEDAWGEPVPDDFRNDYRNKYDDAKAEHDRLAEELADAESDLADADDALRDAEADRRRACEAAEAARRALELCLGAAAAAGGDDAGDGPDDGGDGGGTPPGGPTQPPEEEPEPCAEGTERDGAQRTEDFAVPLDYESLIIGGDAHAAAEVARRITSELEQARIAVHSLGLLFGLAPGRKLVEEFSVSGAAGVGLTAQGELTGIDIPSNPGEIATQYVELLIRSATAVIGAVLEWQERRLPDVELTVQWKAAPYRMTCTDIEVCRDGSWVVERRRVTLERTGPDRSGGQRRLGGGFTWSEAQAQIRRFANVFARQLRRELEDMRAFRNRCAGR
jgi:hypothetical protein